MRYVVIRDDASLADIDEALKNLRLKRLGVRLPIVWQWITEDIDALLEMRSARTAELVNG